MATGICSECGKLKGVRKDGKIASHSTGEGAARGKCLGVGRPPKEQE